MRKIWVALMLAAACGGGGADTNRPLPEGDAGESGAAGRGPGDPDVEPGSGGAAGQGAEAAGGASAGVGGADEAAAGQWFELAGAPAVGPPGVCTPDLELGSNEAVGVDLALADDVALLAVTPDELSVAFTTGEDDALALYVADRESTEAAFLPAPVSLPTGYEAASGVALSGDGLRLVLVMADHSGFGELARASRGLAFGGAPDTTAYARINLLKAMSGRSVGWPVLSNDGNSLYFLSYFGQGLVNQSRMSEEGSFDFGTVIDEYTLGGEEGSYKLPHGISTDERAIFFFDEASQHTKALFRSRANAPFYDPLDLGERRGAAPNADCSRLYSSVSGELVLQTRR